MSNKANINYLKNRVDELEKRIESLYKYTGHDYENKKYHNVCDDLMNAKETNWKKIEKILKEYELNNITPFYKDFYSWLYTDRYGNKRKDIKAIQAFANSGDLEEVSECMQELVLLMIS